MYIKNFVSLPCFGMWRIENLMMTQIMWCGWAAAVEQMRLGSETFVLQVMRILIPAMVVTALMLMVMSGICFDLNLVTIRQTVFENMCRYGWHKNIMQPAPSNVPTYKNKSMHKSVPLHHLAPFLHLDLHSAHGCQSSPVPTRCILVSALGADRLRLGGLNFSLLPLSSLQGVHLLLSPTSPVLI